MDAPFVRSLFRYWRQCLADQDLVSIDFRQSEAFSLEGERWQSGSISEDLTAETFRKVDSEIRRAASGSRSKAEDPPPSIEVQIAPLMLAPFTQHGKSTATERPTWRPYAPFFVSARLDRHGSLLAPIEPRAWIARRFLDPADHALPTLGTLKAMDTFLTHHSRPIREDWTALWQWAQELFEATVGHSVHDFQSIHYARSGPWLIPRRVGSYTKNLIELYDRIEARQHGGRAIPPLARALAAKGRAEPIPPTSVVTPTGADRHLGQMTQRFALDAEQRAGVQAAMRLGEGEILAINGPPGTGKTTLVQSLVASSWVAAALEGPQAMPPILFAVSTNNRAVTNVLERMDVPEVVGEIYARRWLPDLKGYGLAYPTKKKEDPRFPWARSAGSSLEIEPSCLVDRNYPKRARENYLKSAKDALGSSLEDVESAVRALHGRMQNAVQQLRSTLDQSLGIKELRSRFETASPEETRVPIEAERRKVRAELERYEQLHHDFQETVAHGIHWWMHFLTFVPPIRRKRIRQLEMPFVRARLEPPPTSGEDRRIELERALTAWIAGQKRLLEPIEERMEEIEAWTQAERRWREAVTTSWAELPSGSTPAGLPALEDVVADPALLPPLLDLSSRWRLFHLAARFWEGRWLIEEKNARDQSSPALPRDQDIGRFRRLAMLMPLAVSTLHRLPTLFSTLTTSGERETIFETIDLLIVDEAGQVAPEIGAPSFSLAKRAIVIGDVHQLVPVRPIEGTISRPNWRFAGLDPSWHADGAPDPDDFARLDSAHSSLMGVGQRASRFSAPEAKDSGLSPGLWLLDHRRCVPEVIDYCNALVYRGRLRPKREAISSETRALPPFAWGHVVGEAESAGTSRGNPLLAEALADWLSRHREEIEAAYGKPKRGIGSLLGIITPYSRQVTEIRKALRNVGVPVHHGSGGDTDKGIEVGTVHQFQGGERKIIFFASVTTRESSSPTWFLDHKPNLLNVAVSRAEDSFVVFGDMRIFDPHLPSPSGQLGRLLFENENYQLVDVQTRPGWLRRENSNRISGTEAHRKILSQAFEKSRERLLIVSPYLGRIAVDQDGVLEQVRRTAARGVNVTIAYSPSLWRYPNANRDLLSDLRHKGVKLVELRRFHNKTLAVDATWIVEGSFNWLSARRSGDLRNHEASLRCDLPEAARYIEEAWREVEEGARNRQR